MKQIRNAGIIVIAILILLSGLALAKCECGYGTKVKSGDDDLGRPLDDFVLPQIPINLGWWDIGPNPTYLDEDDVIYLDFPPIGIVNANDIRLTAWGSKRAGSKVTSSDNDMGQFIGAVPSGTAAGFYFMDMFGTSTGYDFNDTVYIKIAAPGPDTAANDIRLSPVDTNTVVSANNVSVIFKTLEAGSKIINSDPDIFKPITPMIITFPWPGCPAFGPMAYIRFYNANGNYNAAGLPIYDYEDNVYIDLPWTLGCGDGTVNVNDIRLSEQLT